MAHALAPPLVVNSFDGSPVAGNGKNAPAPQSGIDV